MKSVLFVSLVLNLALVSGAEASSHPSRYSKPAISSLPKSLTAGTRVITDQGLPSTVSSISGGQATIFSDGYSRSAMWPVGRLARMTGCTSSRSFCVGDVVKAGAYQVPAIIGGILPNDEVMIISSKALTTNFAFARWKIAELTHLPQAKSCIPRVVVQTFSYSTVVGVMYGQYGIPSSDSDLEYVKLKAADMARDACENQNHLKSCRSLRPPEITEDNWLTSGIPEITARSIFVGCQL